MDGFMTKLKKDIKWLKLCESLGQIFSTCSKKKYGCFIIDSSGHIVGQGYNGAPPNMIHCEDGGCPRFINNVPSGTNYDSGPGFCVAAHAEQNALSHGRGELYKDSTLYVNGIPCITCAKIICSSGIPKIVCLEDYSRSDRQFVIDFCTSAGVEIVTLNFD